MCPVLCLSLRATNPNKIELISLIRKKIKPTPGIAQLFFLRKMLFPETSQKITLSIVADEAKAFMKNGCSLRTLKWMAHKSVFSKVSSTQPEVPDFTPCHHIASPPTQPSAPVHPSPRPIQDPLSPTKPRGLPRPRKQLHPGRPSKKRKRNSSGDIANVIRSAKKLRTTGDLILLSPPQDQEVPPTTNTTAATTAPITSNELDDAFNHVYDTDLVCVRMTADMGLGVFATKVIPCDTVITKYEGCNLTIPHSYIPPHELAGFVDDKFKTHWISLNANFSILAGHYLPIACLGVGSLINVISCKEIKYQSQGRNFNCKSWRTLKFFINKSSMSSIAKAGEH